MRLKPFQISVKELAYLRLDDCLSACLPPVPSDLDPQFRPRRRRFRTCGFNMGVPVSSRSQKRFHQSQRGRDLIDCHTLYFGDYLFRFFSDDFFSYFFMTLSFGMSKQYKNNYLVGRLHLVLSSPFIHVKV